MLVILAQGIGGLGIFFAGMYLLSENLKKLTGRRFRQTVAAWTKSLWAAEKMAILNITNLTECASWLISRLVEALPAATPGETDSAGVGVAV